MFVCKRCNVADQYLQRSTRDKKERAVGQQRACAQLTIEQSVAMHPASIISQSRKPTASSSFGPNPACFRLFASRPLAAGLPAKAATWLKVDKLFMPIKWRVNATVEATSFMKAPESPEMAAPKTRTQRCREASSSAARSTESPLTKCMLKTYFRKWTSSV
jgi:hypothetical protein